MFLSSGSSCLPGIHNGLPEHGVRSGAVAFSTKVLVRIGQRRQRVICIKIRNVQNRVTDEKHEDAKSKNS